MAVNTITSQSQITFEIASEHACTHVPIARPTDTASELRRSLVGQNYENASHIVVCDGEKFLGVLQIENLFAAPDDATVSTLMDSDAPSVAPGVDQEVAAWHAVQRGESALSVVDKEGRFIGIIPPHRLLEVLLWEHDEDMARMGGFLKKSATARRAMVEPVHWRFWHRVPWLLLGLAGALFAADIVGWFESRLQEKLILAFFIPGIVYLADAVGTQTETVVVRGLSVGIPIVSVAGRELLTGLGIGLALAVVAFPIVFWRWGGGAIALGVALSIFATCSTATIVAMGLPWIFNRFNLDPAFGSGPLATVIQDLLSILIYFAIVSVVV